MGTLFEFDIKFRFLLISEELFDQKSKKLKPKQAKITEEFSIFTKKNHFEENQYLTPIFNKVIDLILRVGG